LLQTILLTARSSSFQGQSAASSPHSILFYLNGEARELSAETIDPAKTLLDYLRDNELLTGTEWMRGCFLVLESDMMMLFVAS
jgi:hypothetical protein